MVFIPEREFELKLRCSKETAINVLKTNSRHGKCYVGYKYHKEIFWGRFQDNEFQLYDFLFYRPSCIITGKAKEFNEKCILYFSVKLHPIGRIILLFGLIKRA